MLICLPNPGWTPVITAALSLQMSLKFCQFCSLASKKKESTRAFTSVVVVVADSVLLNKNSSFIFLSFSFRAKAIKWPSKALSVYFVQLNARLERAFLYFVASLLAHISSHVVNPSATGVIREQN